MAPQGMMNSSLLPAGLSSLQGQGTTTAQTFPSGSSTSTSDEAQPLSASDTDDLFALKVGEFAAHKQSSRDFGSAYAAAGEDMPDR